jgi:hypothetical protein
MVNYLCKRCGYSSNNKTFMKRHFLRKKTCKNTVSDSSIYALYREIFKEEYPNLTNTTKFNQNSEKCEKFTTKFGCEKNVKFKGSGKCLFKTGDPKCEKKNEKVKNEIKCDSNQIRLNLVAFDNVKKTVFSQIMDDYDDPGCEKNISFKKYGNPVADNKYECVFCKKSFKYKSSKERHEKERCSLKYDNNTQNLEIEKMKLEMKHQKALHEQQRLQDQIIIAELRNQIEKLIPKIGNTTYNNQYNIVLNAFGKENTSYIDSTIVSQLIKNGPIKSIPRLLKHIHFNPDHVENNNIKITNLKQPLAQIYTGDKWEYRDKKSTIESMTDKAYGIISEHYNDGSNKYMDDFKDKIEINDKETLKKVNKETEIMILNNSKK